MKRSVVRQICLRGALQTATVRTALPSISSAMSRSRYKRRYHGVADVTESRAHGSIPDPAVFSQKNEQLRGNNLNIGGKSSAMSKNGALHRGNSAQKPASQTSLPRKPGGHQSRTSSHAGSRKRKAVELAADSRPAHRQRTMKSYDQIRAHMKNKSQLPTREQFDKHAPKLLFDPNPIVAINDGLRTLDLKITKETRQAARSVQCRLIAEGRDGFREVAEGEGEFKATAVKAAHLQLLSQMHTSGFLLSVFGPPTDIDELDDRTLVDEADAKSEVYNYSARYGLIPSFTVQEVQRPTLRKTQNAFDVKIELLSQDISVSARRMDLRSAEIAAAVKFKEAAEQFHAKQGTGANAIHGPIMLHTGNAKLFFEYYNMIRRDDKLELNCVSLDGRSRGKEGLPRSGWLAQMMREQTFKRGEPDLSFPDPLEPDKASKTTVALTNPVTMASKKAVEELAQLVAAVTLTKEDPTLLQGFRNSMSSSGTAILSPVRPVNVELDEDAELIMEDTLRDARRAGLADEREQLLADEKMREDSRRRTYRQFPSEERLAAKSERLSAQQKLFNEDPALEELREKKAALPMAQHRAQVLDLVNEHLYSVIVGATGSGKTTQVPQILLEDAISKGQGAKCNVICTQPRRIAATSVAQRVAAERNEKLQATVGYHVRFDARRPQESGSITYCTTGILLQQLQHNPDEMLDMASHIIIDEVHERDIMIDFLMITLKNAIKSRFITGKRVPKVVLMSATIDSELFANYFEQKTADGQIVTCPSLNVPGRTFPVEEKYLHTVLEELQEGNPTINPQGSWMQSDPDTKDYLDAERNFRPSVTRRENVMEDDTDTAIDWKLERRVGVDGKVTNEKEDALVPLHLIAATVASICKKSDEGAILVFLPGLDEMKKVAATMKGETVSRIKAPAPDFGLDFNDATKYKLIMLHSSVPANEQAMAFDPVPPGCRKIILSTNIAETSVTIPDIQYVVDTGKLREKRYDQIRRITQLQCTWISKSNAKQRAGRAGRVQNGNYYALYSRPRFDSLRAIGLPEMLRSDLQEVCLDIKAQALQAPIREFLSQSIEPPAAAAVDASVQNLQSLQALTEEEDLTALGRLLAQLPVHPSLGKMIVLGVIFRCLDPMIILGATLTERSLFVSPPERRREASECQAKFGEGTGSDHYALINAFTQMRLIREEKGQSAMMGFANHNYLHMGAFRTIHATTMQIEEVLVDAGLIPRVARNERFEHECGPPALNTNATNVAVFKALALAGLHPNLALATSNKLLRTPGEKNAMIHPSSLNYVRESLMRKQTRERDTAESSGMSRSEDNIGVPPFSLVSYSTMARSNDGTALLLRDVSMSSGLMALLFGGRLKRTGNMLEMDSWLRFNVRAGPRTVGVLFEFRKALDRMLTRAFGDLSVSKGKRQAPLRGNDASAISLGGSGRKTDDFADDEVSQLFAEALVGVLNRDINRQSRGKSNPRGPAAAASKQVGFHGLLNNVTRDKDTTRERDYKPEASKSDMDDWIFGGKGAGFGQKGEYTSGRSR